MSSCAGRTGRGPTARRATRRAARLFAITLLGVLVAACGVRPDSAPRDIAPDQRGDLSDSGSGGGETPVGGRRVFLVLADGGAGGRDLLRSVPRDVSSSPVSVLTALLQGPTATEQSGRLRTAIPPGTELLSTEFVAPGTLAVNLSSAIFDATGDSLIDAVAQVVYTANEIDGVSRVLLRVDGQDQQWPRGDGALASGALSIYDYPGRVVTTQPDFPAVPSG